ncbi:hypothetical protein [uncultured Parabacteroides sp.]|uniref:hypothetical protein n=1 Tax=uncultured Parabacteroides sp. TaxID=512312 RepID=UPI00259BE941|nr:hypothetical protein [uncultured Parabacteroides sp.]
MQYTSEQLSKIEELASNLMPIDCIAVLTNIDEDLLRQDIASKNNPAGKAYRLGKAKTMLEIQRQEISLAKLASPAAVENATRYITEMETKEL